jgi:hypothetical protein
MNLDLTQLVAIAAALGWASGLRLYAVVFITGLAGWLGWISLPGDLHVLSHPIVLGASGLMLFIEFFVDKIPGLDSIWDAIHTFVRIPAGAALAGAVFGGDPASWVTAAALMGGTLAATSHAAKLTTRASANSLARAVLEHRPLAPRRRRRAGDALAVVGAPGRRAGRAGGGRRRLDRRRLGALALHRRLDAAHARRLRCRDGIATRRPP